LNFMLIPRRKMASCAVSLTSALSSIFIEQYGSKKKIRAEGLSYLDSSLNIIRAVK
jgi:hypothetical protein